MKFKLLISYCLLAMVTFIFNSCQKNCNEIICENDATCTDGTCICLPGFSGESCEDYDLSQIQFSLNNGVSPFQLYKAGVPLEGFYGKEYQQGLIFYLDTIDGRGLVISKDILATDISWGCEGVNIENLIDVGVGGQFFTLGEGNEKTLAILEECDERPIAASICKDLGDDWYLPSRDELLIMKTNLIYNNFINCNIENCNLWSSSEASELRASSQIYNGSFFELPLLEKSSPLGVRAVKIFD